MNTRYPKSIHVSYMQFSTENTPETTEEANLRNTNWSPLTTTNTNFTTHRLVVDGDVAHFKPGVMLYIFTMLFYGAFLGLSFYVLSHSDFQEQIGHQLVMPLKVVLAIAAIVTVYVIYKKLSSPIVFSKINGWFWKGHESPDAKPNQTDLKNAIKLDQIVGLQILGKRQHSTKSTRSYVCYELNLILADHSRINVLTSGGLISMLVEAEELGEFLDVPVLKSKDI